MLISRCCKALSPYRLYRRLSPSGTPSASDHQMAEHTRNVIQLGIGFFFIFCAFNSQGLIEQTVISSYAERDNSTISEHDGYTSLAIIYAVFTPANFIAAPIVERLNARWAIVVAGVAYAIFQAGFLYLNRVYLFLSSALLGLGAAVIWTAQGKYLALNSTEQTASRHSSLFWAISQACLIIGGVFLFMVFHSASPSSSQHYSIEDATVRLIYVVFTGVTVVGIVILALLRLPLRPPTNTPYHRQMTPPASDGGLVAQLEEAPLTHMQVVKSTFKLAATPPMLMLAVASAYTGVELSFWSGIYPTCVASTLRLGTNTKTLLALTAITEGLGQASSGFLFGILSSKTSRLGRRGIIALGALVHLLAFAIIYLNFPSDAPLKKTTEAGLIEPSVVLALLAGGLLGFGDACWNTQIFAHLITKYPKKSAQAFSLFKFFQSLLTCTAFSYSDKLQLHWHLLILVVGMIAGGAGFFLAEQMSQNEGSGEEDNRTHHAD